jgi:hypothetical protein
VGLREYTVRDPNGYHLRFGEPVTAHATATPAKKLPENVRLVERMPTVEEYETLIRAVGWAKYTNLEPALRQDKLGKGGRDVTSTSETFRWSLVGRQSHPVERGQQPEASLAWGGLSRTAKRRQPVPKPRPQRSQPAQPGDASMLDVVDFAAGHFHQRFAPGQTPSGRLG